MMVVSESHREHMQPLVDTFGYVVERPQFKLVTENGIDTGFTVEFLPNSFDMKIGYCDFFVHVRDREGKSRPLLDSRDAESLECLRQLGVAK